MTSRSRASKLIAVATKKCNNDVSGIDSKLSYSKCFTYENSENVRLANVLFSQIMKDKNTDFKNNTVMVDNNIIYDEIIMGPNQINYDNCLTNSSLKESSEISRDTEDWSPQSVINQNKLNL